MNYLLNVIAMEFPLGFFFGLILTGFVFYGIFKHLGNYTSRQEATPDGRNLKQNEDLKW